MVPSQWYRWGGSVSDGIIVRAEVQYAQRMPSFSPSGRTIFANMQQSPHKSAIRRAMLWIWSSATLLFAVSACTKIDQPKSFCQYSRVDGVFVLAECDGQRYHQAPPPEWLEP